jgi:hypothetical protein
MKVNFKIVIFLAFLFHITCDIPKFKQYSLTSFDKHKSYLPLYRGDYFSIEVFLHEKDYDWRIENIDSIKKNNILKILTPENENKKYSNLNSMTGSTDHIVVFEFYVNDSLQNSNYEELIFAYKSLKDLKNFLTKTVNVKIISHSKKDDL